MSPLQILYLEDDPRDAELVQAALESEDLACHITRVETQPDFIHALKRELLDLILADYTLPSFDGISALKIAKEIRPEVPFIFVTGTLGEEVAIEALKLGATDYVFKTRLGRIAPSVQRALREAQERSERKRAQEALLRNEAYLAEAQRLSHTGSFGWHVSSGRIYWSEETFRIFEIEPAAQTTLELAFERIHPEDRQLSRQILNSAAQERKALDFEQRLLMPDGSVKYVRVVGHPREESGDLEFVGSVTDITERKRAEALLAAEKRSLEMIATGASLTTILDDLCRAIDARSPSVISSVLLMDPDGKRLWPVAGPEVPRGWSQAIAGGAIGPRAGSCGTAAFLKKRVISSDIASDPLWVDYRDLALSHGLRASWSQPLISKNHEVLGTFAMYYGEPRIPSSSDLQLIEAAGHIALIAIERRRTEDALQESEERFRQMADALPEVMWILGLEPERVLYASPSFERIWGLPVEELYQKPRIWTEAIHPEDRDRVVGTFARWIAGENVSYNGFEYRIIQRNGDVRWIHELGVLTLNQQGKPYRASGISTDITERKRAESLFRESEQRFRAIFNEAGTGIALADLDSTGRIENNRALQTMLGCNSDELSRLETYDELTCEEDRASDAALYRELQDGRIETLRQEKHMILRDGRSIWANVVFTLLRDPEGRPKRIIAIHEDVTERKRAEDALRQSEQRLRDVIETIPTLAWTSTPEGTTDFVNQRWLEYTGVSLEDTSGVGWKVAFHPADIASQAEKWRESLATGKPFENEARLRRASDGQYRWFLHRGVPLRDERAEIVKWFGTATDIEDRKLAEEALQRSEGYLAEAQRLSHSGSWAWNVRTKELYWSKETFQIFGIEEDAIPTSELFQQRIHPDDRGAIDPVDAVVLSGREGEYNYRIVFPDRSIKYIRSVARPVTDDSGQVIEFVGTVIDVTEQRNAHDALKQAFEEIRILRDQLYRENIALRDEVDKASMFEEIVGDSPALQSVLARVSKVAPSDSTVLITGETGTGKELVARALHKRSQRSSRAFVTVNCAATPASLITSELFGHEKGAFTGALQRRLGRFELAEGGTIFLDEVGELPMETQIALLRVLQEREFERVGGNQPIRANVRIIAATNRDLQTAIASGTFRSDLLYRLNVIPMEIPPLRERKEDIPMLVEYFINRYSRKAGKKIRSVEKKSLELLQSYSWPGNIRELQNVIERSVVVCEGEMFSVDRGWFSHAASLVREPGPSESLGRRSAAQEREIIEAALAETQGRVSGPFGAATQLGMPASTLESKIRTLKINKHRFKSA